MGCVSSFVSFRPNMVSWFLINLNGDILNIMKKDAQNEIDKNYETFREKLPELLEDENNLNKFSLWHNRSLVGIYDTESDAIKIGKEKYEEFGKFSVQQITNDALDIGFISLCQ